MKLYAHFDENADGYLSYAEAQKALEFIDPIAEPAAAASSSAAAAADVTDEADDLAHEIVPVATAFPPHAFTPSGELRLDGEWFWAVFQRMG